MTGGATVLFKHMRAQHAALLVNMGVIRIGTLADFRKSEVHGNQIGDDAEGVRIDEYPADLSFTAEDQPEWSKQSFKLKPGARLRIQSYGIRHKITSQDQWILSFSETSAPSVGKEICTDYDACVEIVDIASFLRGVSFALGGQNKYEGIYKCRYERRSQDGDTRKPVHPALLKDPTYQYQQEVRAIWSMGGKSIFKPSNVANIELTNYCRRLF
jgi:hypothetical protein